MSPTESPVLEFWFEFGSTYSYPAVMRVERMAAERGVALAWRPFLLGPIFREQGWETSPFNENPAKGRYMWRDVERVCAALQIPFKKPSTFPRISILASRIACHHVGSPWVPEFARRVFIANFSQDFDIANRAVIESCLDAMGVPVEEIVRAAESDASKQALREQTEHARALGIFGAPFFVVAGEMFWGNDRLEMALDWAAGTLPPKH